MTHAPWIIAWDRGRAAVQPSGAMVGPVDFRLDDGRTVQPFAVAPWSDDVDPRHAALPELLKRLRGEWVCIPYGMPDHPADLPAAWLPETAEPGEDDCFHGYSSNADWQLDQQSDAALELCLDYPAGHPVRRVTRRIAGVAGRSALAFEVGVETRRDAILPIGLHPVLRLAPEAGAASLTFDGDARAHTYPIDAEAGVSRLVPGLHAQRLDRMSCHDGTVVDLTRHPLAEATEELVLVTGHGGGATLANAAEGYVVRLTWDAAAFPSCMLWVSNRGRQGYPWNGRFQALAIEPVNAPFDLGTAVARNAGNPLRRAGIATGHPFTANVSWRTRYQIEVTTLPSRAGVNVA